MRLANLRALHQPHQVRRRRNLACMWPGLVNPRVESSRRAHQRLQRHRPRQIRQLRHAQPSRHGQRAHGGHSLRPVQQRQTLLGRQCQRLHSSPPQRLAAGHPFAFQKRLALPDRHQRQVSQRRQVPARTHRTLFRNHRMHPGVEQRNQQFHQRGPAAAKPLGQHVGAQQQHGPRLRLRERLPHPSRVAAHKVGL